MWRRGRVRRLHARSSAWTLVPPGPRLALALAASLLPPTVWGGLSTAGTGTAAAAASPTDFWRPVGTMSMPRVNPVAFQLGIGGKVIVAGGEDVSTRNPLRGLTDVFDPATNTWTTGPRMPVPVDGAALAGLANGDFVVAGGSSATGPTTAVQLYDPSSRTWSLGTPLPVGCPAAKAVGNDVWCAAPDGATSSPVFNLGVMANGAINWGMVGSTPPGSAGTDFGWLVPDNAAV